MDVLGIVLFFAVLYFVPTLCTLGRSIKTPQGPILLNIFLGWTVLGWIAALIWAACAPVQPSTASELSPSYGVMQQLGRIVGRIGKAIRPIAKP